MTGACQQCHAVSHQRREKGDVTRMTTQQAFRQAYQIIHAARHLHGGDGGDHAHDNFNHVKGDGTRLHAAHQRQHQHAKAAGKTDTDTAEARAKVDRQ